MYPDWPDNRLIVDGKDITMTYKVALIDGYELDPPEPKTYTVDIPGGNGVIDLTDALTGDVVYNNRTQKFSFISIDPSNYEQVKTEISNDLHGKAFDYQLTWDPGYTYHGRFSVSSYTHEAFSEGSHIVGTIEITIDSDPYKLKEHCVYKLNATGGRMFRLESGRMPVHPVIECSEPCVVTWKNIVTTVPAGTYRLNHVLFEDGWNEIYINSRQFWNIMWADVAESGSYPLTWVDAASLRWDDIQRLGGDVQDVLVDWDDIAPNRWSEVSEKIWADLGTANIDIPDVYVYLSYDWKDL